MEILFYIAAGAVAVWLLARDKGTPAPASDKPGELTLPVNCDASADPVACWKQSLEKGLAAPAVKGMSSAGDDPYGGTFDLASMPNDAQNAAVHALQYEGDIITLLQLADEAERAGYPLAAVRFRKKAFSVAKLSDS